MTRVVPTSLNTSTDTIEHALLHAREETWHCDLCDEKGAIGTAELELALESRLLNARALVQAIRDPRQSTALMRSMTTLDYLIREAQQLCTLSHRTDKELLNSLPRLGLHRQRMSEALRSIANCDAGPAASVDTYGA